MKAFAQLWERLDTSTKTSAKVAALADYFAAAPPADAAWALSYLLGERPKRLIPSARLREWASELAAIPPWLFEECYAAVGDLAETLSLLIAPWAGAGEVAASDNGLAWWIENHILPLPELEPEQQRELVVGSWRRLEPTERFLWNKLITGAFRVGVAKGLVLKALERVTGVRSPVLAHRLMGHWHPSPTAWRDLIRGDDRDADLSRPYPFLLAHALPGPVAELGPRAGWLVEWVWDGVRAQVVRRGASVFVWSRGEELVTDRFPEVVEAAQALPEGTVLDGEILVVRDGEVGSFASLQRRLGRKKVGRVLLEEAPVAFFAFDLLELEGRDCRDQPAAERRRRLELLLAAGGRLRPAPLLEVESWEQVEAAWARSREERAEGLMLKRADSGYGVGRVRDCWWKWKLDPLTADVVLVYAQRGHGRRASLYSDYTFAVWKGDELVPIAKAYSGLTDAEITEVDRFVRRNAREKFGPVRSVSPELVFEIAFEGIQPSSRHKSGLAVRFPRIVRWRRDKKAAEADRLEQLEALVAVPRV
jgi:DNA ligase-1